MRLIFIVFVLGSLSCRSLPSTRQPAGAAQVLSAMDAKIIRLPEDKLLTYDKLKTLLSTRNIESIEALLEILSSEYSDYLKFHTYVYNSRSLQGSRYHEPRAIVFGPEARFILAFNDSKDPKGGTNLETMEFAEPEKRFKFREIYFKKAPPPPTQRLADRSIEFQNDHVVISNPNLNK